MIRTTSGPDLGSLMGGGGLFSGRAEKGEGNDGGGEGKEEQEHEQEEEGFGGEGEPSPSLLPLLDTFLLILTMMDGSNTQQRAHGRHVEVRNVYRGRRRDEERACTMLVERPCKATPVY